MGMFFWFFGPLNLARTHPFAEGLRDGRKLDFTCDTQRQNLVYLELSTHDIRARLPAYLELRTHDTRSNQIFSSPLGVQYT
jgi:hypothetical protein